MKKLILLISLTNALAQVPPCFSPTIFPIVAGQPNSNPPVSIYFLCNNLSSPNLLGSNCPNNFNVLNATIGQMIYIGFLIPSVTNPNGLLHLGSTDAFLQIDCTNCIVDGISQAENLNELPVGMYTIGTGMQSTWNGVSPFPQVNVFGCNSFVINQGPGVVNVTCNTGN